MAFNTVGNTVLTRRVTPALKHNPAVSYAIVLETGALRKVPLASFACMLDTRLSCVSARDWPRLSRHSASLGGPVQERAAGRTEDRTYERADEGS
jgi:hypothetical protein